MCKYFEKVVAPLLTFPPVDVNALYNHHFTLEEVFELGSQNYRSHEI